MTRQDGARRDILVTEYEVSSVVGTQKDSSGVTRISNGDGGRVGSHQLSQGRPVAECQYTCKRRVSLASVAYIGVPTDSRDEITLIRKMLNAGERRLAVPGRRSGKVVGGRGKGVDFHFGQALDGEIGEKLILREALAMGKDRGGRSTDHPSCSEDSALAVCDEDDTFLLVIEHRRGEFLREGLAVLMGPAHDSLCIPYASPTSARTSPAERGIRGNQTRSQTCGC